MTKQDAVDMQIEGADETTAAFKFVGTKNNIENAKALMDYLITSHQELDTLQVISGLELVHEKMKIAEICIT